MVMSAPHTLSCGGVNHVGTVEHVVSAAKKQQQTVKHIKDQLSQLGLPITGNKPELTWRLQQALAGDAPVEVYLPLCIQPL